MSIFDDNEDFELAPGGDDARVEKKPVRTPPTPPRPAVTTRKPPTRRPPVSPSPAPTPPVRPNPVQPRTNTTPTAPRVRKPESIAPAPKTTGLRPAPKPYIPAPKAEPEYEEMLHMTTVPVQEPKQQQWVEETYEDVEIPQQHQQREEETYQNVDQYRDVETDVHETLPPAATEGYERPSYEDSVTDQHNSFGYDDARPIRHTEVDEERLPQSLRQRQYAEDEGYRRRTPINIAEEDEEEEEYKPTKRPSRSSKPSSGKGKTSTKRNATSNKKSKKKSGGLFGKKSTTVDEDGEELPPSRFFGGRKKVLIVNCVAGAVILGVLGFGLNSIFNPPYVPSPNDMKGLVAEQLNITKFDKDGGRAIVSAFTKEYLSVDQSTSTKKSDRLEAFTTETVASAINSSTSTTTGWKQSVAGEPYIVDIEAIDDANAVYNVGAKLGNKWVYLDIPVFYDERNLSYTISGVPSFTPPPTVATLGAKKPDEISNDGAVSDKTKENITSFFRTWAASDAEGLGRYITGDADAETRGGLQGTVAFLNLKSYTVETKKLEDPTEKTRRAFAVVEWGNSSKGPAMKYEQTFELELFRQPDDRWYVADITPVQNIYAPVELSD